MLHKETVDSGTLRLLKSIQSIEAFSGFYLVGGTALSLALGHRVSVDLDLFTSEEGIKMFSLEDIVAMKLAAVMNNGTRLKDFVDLAFLSKRFALKEMLGFFSEKYPNVSCFAAQKGLTFFDYIDYDAPIRLMSGAFEWGAIRKRILSMALHPYDRFSDFPI